MFSQTFFGENVLYDPDLDPVSERYLFYDSFSERYFTHTLPGVLQAQYHLNRNFVLGCGVSLNDFYDLLGLDRVPHGEETGWGEQFIIDGFNWIDFENKYTKVEEDANGLECYIISAPIGPDPF